MTFGGLTPAGRYRFEHVAARALGDDRIADYRVNGRFADSTPNGDNFASLADGWAAGHVLVWESVIADSAGTITLSVEEVRNFGYLSASMLQSVPEPAVPNWCALVWLAVVQSCLCRAQRTS